MFIIKKIFIIIFKKAEVQERKMLAESFVSIGSNSPGSQLHMEQTPKFLT